MSEARDLLEELVRSLAGSSLDARKGSLAEQVADQALEAELLRPDWEYAVRGYQGARLYSETHEGSAEEARRVATIRNSGQPATVQWHAMRRLKGTVDWRGLPSVQ